MSDPGEDRAAASSNTGADGASTDNRPSVMDLLKAAKADNTFLLNRRGGAARDFGHDPGHCLFSVTK